MGLRRDERFCHLGDDKLRIVLYFKWPSFVDKAHDFGRRPQWVAILLDPDLPSQGHVYPVSAWSISMSRMRTIDQDSALWFCRWVHKASGLMGDADQALMTAFQRFAVFGECVLISFAHIEQSRVVASARQISLLLSEIKDVIRKEYLDRVHILFTTIRIVVWKLNPYSWTLRLFVSPLLSASPWQISILSTATLLYWLLQLARLLENALNNKRWSVSSLLSASYRQKILYCSRQRFYPATLFTNTVSTNVSTV